MTLTNLFILGYWIFLYKFKRHLKTKQNSVTFHKLFVLHYSSKSIYSVNAFRKLRGARKKVNTRWRELIRRVLRSILLLRRCVWMISYEHEFLSLSCTKKYFSLTCVYKISSVRVTCLFRLIERAWIFFISAVVVCMNFFGTSTCGLQDIVFQNNPSLHQKSNISPPNRIITGILWEEDNIKWTYRYIVILACCSDDLSKGTSSEEFSYLEVCKISWNWQISK